MQTRIQLRNSLIASALLCSACNPLIFDDLKKEAPSIVIKAPSKYKKSQFGTVVSAYEGVDANNVNGSRLAIAGGASTSFIVYAAGVGNAVDFKRPLFDGCDDTGECEAGAGTSIAGFPKWQAGTASEQRLCILLAAPEAVDPNKKIQIVCETDRTNYVFRQGPTTPMSGFGTSAVGLTLNDLGIGIALVGAPGQGDGAVYRIKDGGMFEELSFPGLTLSTNAKFGAAMARGRMADGRLMVAIAALDAHQVIVAAIRILNATAGTIEITVLRTITGTADGYGGALAVGDLNGDQKPEVIVGNASKVTMSTDPMVEIYDGATIDVPTSTPTMLACPDLDPDVKCAGSKFGFALAVGDVNADSTGDLLVGAPRATAEGKTNAGALFVIPGTAGASINLNTTDASVLRHSDPEENDQLGQTVTSVRTHLDGTPRDEPVAGVPGANQVFVFLCANITGDTTSIGKRCIPTML